MNENKKIPVDENSVEAADKKTLDTITLFDLAQHKVRCDGLEKKLYKYLETNKFGNKNKRIARIRKEIKQVKEKISQCEKKLEGN